MLNPLVAARHRSIRPRRRPADHSALVRQLADRPAVRRPGGAAGGRSAGRTAARLGAVVSIAAVFAGGCAPSRSTLDLPGDGWPTPIASNDLFDPLPDPGLDAASANGRSNAVFGPSLDRPLVPGTSLRLESEVVVEVRLTDGSAAATSPFTASAQLMPAPADGFRGLTVARLIGRLDIDAVDGTGALERGRFTVSDGALIRDGGLLATFLDGDSIDIDVDGLELTGWTSPSPGGPQASMRQDGGPLSSERQRLMQLCLFGPLHPIDWDGLVAWTGASSTPPPGGPRGWIDDADAARLVGLSPPSADAEFITAGQSRTRRPTAEERATLGDGWIVETRSVAGPANDPRVAAAFGSAMQGRGSIAARHRWLAPFDTASGSASRESVVVSRFRLRDERGMMRGERTQRQRVRITPMERAPDETAADPGAESDVDANADASTDVDATTDADARADAGADSPSSTTALAVIG